MKETSEAGLRFGFEDAGDLTGIREAAGIRLRVDDLPVARHLKDTARSRVQRRFQSKRLLELGRHTGSLRLIVSHTSVKDIDLHLEKASKADRHVQQKIQAC